MLVMKPVTLGVLYYCRLYDFVQTKYRWLFTQECLALVGSEFCLYEFTV